MAGKSIKAYPANYNLNPITKRLEPLRSTKLLNLKSNN